DFQLQPVMGTIARLVARIDALGNYAFPALTPRFFQHFLAVAFDGLGKAKLWCRTVSHPLDQSGAPIRPRLLEQDVFAIHEDVEKNESSGGGRGMALDDVRHLDVHTALEFLETRRFSVDERDDLAVQHQRPFALRGEFFQSGDNLRELFCLVFPVSSYELDVGWSGIGKHANAIVFRLEGPTAARNVATDARIHWFERGGRHRWVRRRLLRCRSGVSSWPPGAVAIQLNR